MTADRTADYDAHDGERCVEHGIPGCLRAHPAENDAAPVVQWAHVLDDTGSADLYDTEPEARESLALVGGGLDRIETTTVVPFSVLPPGSTDERGQA